MHNMSNQFYDYISNKIIEYFINAPINKGSRFYLQLDSSEEVETLYNSFAHQNNVKEFSYTHEYGELFRTISIEIGKILLVIVKTSNTIKPDYLVTIRNKIGEQLGEWQDTALLSIVSEQLDSIQGGSSDLQKDGMPLHPKTIYESLEKKINESCLEKVEQKILINNMEAILKEIPYQKINFLDFEHVFNVLIKGEISENDYKYFALFKDHDKGTFTGEDLNNRLRINRELFEYIRRVHEFGLDEEELENKFSHKGVIKLKESNWSKLSFSEVYQYYKENQELNKEIHIKFEKLKSFNEGIEIWDKSLKETAAGKRKRQIILFNPNQFNKIEFQAIFTIAGGNVKSLINKFIKLKKNQDNLLLSVGRRNINITLKTESGKPSFYEFSYYHNDKVTLGAEFHIAVLPIYPEILENFSASYLVNVKSQCIEVQNNDDKLIFGNNQPEERQKTIEVKENNSIINFSSNEQLILVPYSEAFDEEENLKFELHLIDTDVKFLLNINNELPESTPITGMRIWKLKMLYGKNFQVEGNHLVFNNIGYYFHVNDKLFFDREQKWISDGMQCAHLDAEQLISDNIEISDNLREAYSRYITYFKTKSIIPSLAYFSDELKKRAEDYVSTYIREVKSFEEGREAGKKARDLFKLGTISSNESILFTPCHPLMVAFQIKANDLIRNENVDNSILSRIRPEGLIPFIYDDGGHLYKPDSQSAPSEWIVFKPVDKVTVSDSNKNLERVIQDKLFQFINHFHYLFDSDSKSPLRINVVNISNDREILKGIINCMLKSVEKYNTINITPIEVTLYNNQPQTSFDLLSRISSVEEFEVQLVVLKIKGFNSRDLLRMIQSKLFYYKKVMCDEYRYAHISFYKMQAHENYAIQPMDEMVSGVSLEGVYSSVPSMRGEEDYKTGFGIRAFTVDNNNLLTQVAYYLNELAANMSNGGNNAYHKGEAIFSRTTTVDERTLKSILSASHWVTFIDPIVDLDYFNDRDKDFVVIHYNDQYSSSTKYDAITVTDKVQQYYAVIRDFLNRKSIEGNEENVKNTVLGFNTFNGEWLLRIIGSKGNFSKEKLSIISAIKYSLSYFDHPDILWVPISLEEILRVAGVVGLSKSDGVFTAKNLGITGSKSDDLLLIGLNDKQEKLIMYLYPIEVKIGINSNAVIDKANSQVRKTSNVLRIALSENKRNVFSNRFYRNFFVQLFILNAKKISQSGLWKARKAYALSNNIIEKLNKENYIISNELQRYIGEGAILSFQKNTLYRSAKLEDNITILNLTENDGFHGLVQSIADMHHWIQKEESDFIKENLLSYQFKVEDGDEELNDKNEECNDNLQKLTDDSSDYSVSNQIKKIYKSGETEENKADEKQNNGSGESLLIMRAEEGHLLQSVNVDPNFEEKQGDNLTDIENVRILIGTAENSNKKIYWEYGNKGLANRHLLISGKSGQGKTYFMQCLLLELSKCRISSIVIDYTEGFLPNQLEKEFLESLGDNLKQRIVFNQQLPINPFKKNIRDIGGITLPESDTDVAERIKSVFGAVYKSLGVQQLNAIYEAVLNGLKINDQSMDLKNLQKALEEDGSNYAKTALSQIRPLIDRNPFTYKNSLNWGDIIKNNGEVFIVQLTGYPRDVQLIITEFILWDLWNYSVRFGLKDLPMPVILDEAQNLDHTEKSPSARILTEGRKFGWSAWYATQFLKSQLGADELARLQNSSEKVFFAPPEQEISNIATTLGDEQMDKKGWEKKLLSLKKGQCIVQGPILKENGELSQSVVNIVNISPLKTRI